MKDYDYGYLPDFIADVISNGLLRSMNNQLREHWNRNGEINMVKSISIVGSKLTITINTPEGEKFYRIKVKKAKLK